MHQSSVVAPQLDSELIISTFGKIIELDAEAGAIQLDDGTHRRYLRALTVALATHDNSSFSFSTRRDQNDHQQNLRESENSDFIERTPFVKDRSDPVLGDEDNYSTTEHLQAGYPSQPTIPFCEGTDWNPYSLIEPGHLDGNNLVGQPIDLMELPINEPMFNPPSLQNYESAQSSFHPNHSEANLMQNSGPGERQEDAFCGFDLDSLQKDEVLDELLGSDTRQNDLGAPRPSDFGLDQPRFHMTDFLTCNDPMLECLNSENELSVATEPWKTKNDGNNMLR